MRRLGKLSAYLEILSERFSIPVVPIFVVIVGIMIIAVGMTTYFVLPKEKKTAEPKPTVARVELIVGYQEGKFKENLPRFASYLAGHKNDYEIRSLYAMSLLLTGDSEKAIKEYRAIVEKRPRDSDALYQGGIAMSQLGRVKDAIDYIVKAIRAKPDVPLYYAELARLLTKDGQLDAALNAWQQVLSKTPERDEYRATIIAEMVALYREKGQLDEAAEIVDNALMIDPGNRHLQELSSQISAANSGRSGTREIGE